IVLEDAPAAMVVVPLRLNFALPFTFSAIPDALSASTPTPFAALGASPYTPVPPVVPRAPTSDAEPRALVLAVQAARGPVRGLTLHTVERPLTKDTVNSNAEVAIAPYGRRLHA